MEYSELTKTYELIEGSSTYSVGLVTHEFPKGMSTFGIPLKIYVEESVDWYLDRTPDSVGINYYDQKAQRWNWHSEMMPPGAFDTNVVMTEGYQLSTSNATKYTFIGV